MVSDRSQGHINAAVKEISEDAKRATEADVRKVIEVADGMTYMKDDSFNADPSVALGSVLVTRVGSDKGSPFVFPVDVTIKPKSLLSGPTLRGEIIVDKGASFGFDVQSLVEGGIGAEDVAEMSIIDNYAARVDTGAPWREAVREWREYPETVEMLADPSVQSVSVVVGVVQKYVTVKRYSEYKGDAKVKAYGVNVEGKLYTSTSSYSLAIVYGLSLVDLLRVRPENTAADNRAPVVATDALRSVELWANARKTPMRALARSKGLF